MPEPKKETDPKKAESPKKKVQRSPNYPGIDIKDAIDKARKIYEKDGTHEASRDTIFEHWGYKPGVGPALVALAALRAFGLLEDGKSPKSQKLSRLALDILLNTEDELARAEAIRRAAKKPTMHQVLLEKYGTALPSDVTLKHFLVTEKGFTDLGARQFVKEYRATFNFANLGEGARISEEQEDEQTRGPIIAKKASDGGTVTETAYVHQAVKLPLGGGRWATLQAPFPFSTQDWDLMLAVLQAMKPGLVQSGSASPKPEDSESDGD